MRVANTEARIERAVREINAILDELNLDIDIAGYEWDAEFSEKDLLEGFRGFWTYKGRIKLYDQR